MNSGIASFQKEILEYYRVHGRTFPWRMTTDPYKILVSEIMLQQTQTERVAVKYPEFVSALPDFAALASAPLSTVLGLWQGMGYNRRARNLKQTAEKVMSDYGGRLPREVELLMKLPGIGHATASSICAYAFNEPVVYIETNIRRVFIHHFFDGQEVVEDKEILPLLEKALYRENPREWYNALMDWGVKLKKEGEDANRRSAGYSRQSPFKGSNRQIRGEIIRLLTRQETFEEAALLDSAPFPRERVAYCLKQLEDEGFLCAENGIVKLEQ